MSKSTSKRKQIQAQQQDDGTEPLRGYRVGGLAYCREPMTAISNAIGTSIKSGRGGAARSTVQIEVGNRDLEGALLAALTKLAHDRDGHHFFGPPIKGGEDGEVQWAVSVKGDARVPAEEQHLQDRWADRWATERAARKPGRPKTGEEPRPSKAISARFWLDQVATIDALAKRLGLNRSAVIEQIVTTYLASFARTHEVELG